MSLEKYIATQFSDPKGVGGRVISAIMNRQNRPLYEETIRQLSPADTDHVLDIGCGNGYVLSMVARRYHCLLAGIDTSDSMIKAASRSCHQFVKDGRMTFMCQNVDSMTFADHSFDKAYAINTVYFWENLDRAMGEIRRVLKPGGLFINALYSDETLARFSHTKFGYRHFSLGELENVKGFTAKVVPVLDGAAYCILYHKTNL